MILNNKIKSRTNWNPENILRRKSLYAFLAPFKVVSVNKKHYGRIIDKCEIWYWAEWEQNGNRSSRAVYSYSAPYPTWSNTASIPQFPLLLSLLSLTIITDISILLKIFKYQLFNYSIIIDYLVYNYYLYFFICFYVF